MSELKKYLRLAPIAKAAAVALLQREHPLGAGCLSFSVAIGVFWHEALAGVLTFGGPITNKATFAFCQGREASAVRQGDCLELRKMWLADVLPKNSESRTLAVAALLIRRQYSHVKLLITYCDAAEQATAYRACGWQLAGKSEHISGFRLADGSVTSIRSANRQRVTAKLRATAEAIRVARVKLYLALDPSIRIASAVEAE